MKILLENEMEYIFWSILLAAHYKWKKDYRDNLLNQMQLFPREIFTGEFAEAVEKEIEARLKDEVDEYIPGETEQEYIERMLKNFKENCFHNYDEKDIKELKENWKLEYKDLIEEIKDRREILRYEIEEEIANFFLNFCIDPKNVTVRYNDEILQFS